MQMCVTLAPLLRSISMYSLCELHRPLRTVHSALCTRVLLNLRKVAARASPTGREESDFLTTLALEPFPEYSDTQESDYSMPPTEDFELQDAVQSA